MTDNSSSASDEQHTAIDTSAPNLTRIWNYWLGGKDNYPVDRQASDQVIAMFPDISRMARSTRAFLVRAVNYLVSEAGIRQFLDIGTGLPTANSTHEVAQALAPESRIVYVDNDPLVLLHARALLTSTPAGTCHYIDADVRNPDEILAIAAETLDFTKPIAIMLLGVLGQIPDSDDPQSIVRRLLDAAPSGSYLTLSDSVNTNGTYNQAIGHYNESSQNPYHLRSPEQITEFFDDLELVEPGIVPVTRWRPEAIPLEDIEDVPVLGGVGRKISEHMISEESPGAPSGSVSQVTRSSGSGERNRRLAEISHLESGWLDGEGEQISQSVINLALVIGEKLAEHGVINPNIYPTIDGGVVFEWSRGPQELSIEAKPDLSLLFARVDVDAGTITESTVEESNLSEAIDAMNGMV